MIRQLKGIENNFANQFSQDNLILGIKFTKTKYVHQVVDNLKKNIFRFKITSN